MDNPSSSRAAGLTRPPRSLELSPSFVMYSARNCPLLLKLVNPVFLFSFVLGTLGKWGWVLGQGHGMIPYHGIHKDNNVEGQWFGSDVDSLLQVTFQSPTSLRPYVYTQLYTVYLQPNATTHRRMQATGPARPNKARCTACLLMRACVLGPKMHLRI